MSNFFSFGMKLGGRRESIKAEGCPLEDHPFWKWVHGTASSNMCWASSDGRAIKGAVGNSNYANLAFKGQFRQDGSIGCIVEKVVTVNGHYVLPIAGRMIDWDNFIGARTAQGKYEVIDKVGGSYHTLFSGGTPAVGDEILLVLTGQYWKFIVNGSQLVDGTTNLAEEEGYWGCSSHAVSDGDTLVSKITITDASLAKTPCMTSPTDPYGEVSASSIFGASYPSWKGMNCSSAGSTNCWISAIAPMPQWIQWIGPTGDQPAMVPDLLHIEGRSITASHNTARGPKKLTMLGTVDGQNWDEVQTWDDLDFGATRIMDLPVSGGSAFTGVRLRVDEIREAGAATQIGTFTVHGHFGTVLNLFPDPDIANWTLMNLTVAGETVDASDANYSLHTWDTLVCPVTEGESYVFEFEAQNNGGTVANYATFDVTNGVFIENVTSYFSQINDTGFTKVRVNITAPAGCSEIAVSPARGNDGPDCHLLIKNCKFYVWG